jgi:ribosomal protein S18 acetylase RimI-like enzyme
MMFSICQATDDDLAFLEDVFLRAMRVHITATRGFWDEAKERSQFREQLQLRRARIIECNGLRVGFFITLERGQDIELHTLCIAPEHQGQGLGSAVTRQILSDAHAHRCGVVLSVLKANMAARSLYERLGFTITEELVHHYRMRLVS